MAFWPSEENGLIGFGVGWLHEQTPHQQAYAPLPQPDGTLVHDPDFSLPTTAGPLPWRLFHYSDSPSVEGPFGYGRRASWPLRLCADTSGGRTTVTLEREEGYSVRYAKNEDDTSFTPLTPRLYDTLVRNGDGSWVETRFDTGASFTYDTGPFTTLLYYQTVQGQTVSFLLDSQQQLESIIDPIGRRITYSYSSDGYVTTVTDWALRIHTLQYSGGDLVQLQGPAGGITTFSYDDSHRLTEIIDPDGFVTSYDYDDYNRVINRTVDGNISQYSYSGDSVVYKDPAGHNFTTTLDQYRNVIQTIDPMGAVRSAQYSPRGLPTAIIDAIGRITTLSYDDNGREKTHQDPTGAIYTRTYDGYGNLRSEQDPVNRWTYYDYDGDGQTRQRSTETNGVGRVTSYTYNSWGALKSIQTPMGYLTTYSWNNQGTLDTEKDARGYVRTFQYDLAGDRTTLINEMGHTTTMSYDAEGRLTGSRNALGNYWQTLYTSAGHKWVDVNALGDRTTYAYNGYGQQITLEDAKGHIWSTIYDPKGREIGRIDPMDHLTQSVYDPADRRIVEVDAMGRRTTITYDLARQPKVMTDPAGLNHQTEYDRAGRATVQITPDGLRTTTVYNPAGQVQAIIDPVGLISTTTYDMAARPWEYMSSSGAIVTTSYDWDGRAIEHMDMLGRRFTSVYDEVGQLRVSIDPLARMHTTTYDGSGYAVTETSWEGTSIQRSFNDAGRLYHTTDHLGLDTNIQYDDEGQLEWYTEEFAGGQYNTYYEFYDPIGQRYAYQDEFGNRYTHTYDPARRVTAYADTFGNAASMIYDDSDALQTYYEAPSQTDRTDYFYDDAGRFHVVQDAIGNKVTVGYDSVSGRLQSVLDQNGAATQFLYDPFGRHAATQDSRNNKTTINYDQAGRIAGTTDAKGYRFTTVYDALNRPVGTIDARGFRTTTVYGTMTYDPTSQFVQHTDELGYITTSLYDAKGNLSVSIDALNKATTYNYDQFNRPKSRQNARSFITTTLYDYDRVQAITNARGFATTYAYDSRNQLWSVQDPLGYLTTNIYENSGRLQAVQDARGFRTTTVYDDFDRVSATVDARGYRTTNTYDTMNRLWSVQDARGYLTTNVYDSKERLWATIDALNQRTTLGYDSEDNLTSHTNPRGYTTYYGYDSRNQMQTVQDARSYVTTYGYDELGRRNSIQDPMGFRTTMVYDGRGQQTTTQDALGYLTTTQYDPVGMVQVHIDPLLRRTTYTYDEVQQLKETWRADNTRVTSTYDAVGNLLTHQNARSYVTTYVYDARNQQKTMQDALGYVTTSGYDERGQRILIKDPLGFVTTMVYDGRGQQIATIDALGYRSTTVYDPVGLPIVHVDALNYRTTLTYDPLQRLGTQQNAQGTVTTFSYDGANNRTGVVNGLGYITTYTYEERDLLTGKQDPLGRWHTFTYERRGLRETMQDAKGQVTTSTYTPRREESIRQYADQTLLTFTYDPAGQMIGVADPLGLYTYSYDSMGRLLTQNRPGHPNGQPISFTYDPNGNRALMQTPWGVFTYTYEARDLLSVVYSPRFSTNGVSAGRTTYLYDERGLLSRQSNARGSLSTFVYDPVGRQVQVRHSNSAGGEIEHSYLSLDAVGKPLWKDTFAGRYTYTYDVLDQLTSENNPKNGLTTWTYDILQRRATQQTASTLTTYTYDRADQLTGSVAGTALTTYTYDPNGSTVLIAAPASVTTYQWDAVNRLSVAQLPSGQTFTHTYGYDDLRHGRLSASRTDTLLWDGTEPLYRVGVSSGSTLTEWYVNGLGLVRLVGQNVAGMGVSNIERQYHLDAQGSVEAITDGTLLVSGQPKVTRYQTDAWGNVLSTTASDEPFVYMGGLGYWNEAEEGLDYVRARWLNPATGEWLSADSVEGELRYSYAENSPTFHTDPSGNQSQQSGKITPEMRKKAHRYVTDHFPLKPGEQIPRGAIRYVTDVLLRADNIRRMGQPVKPVQEQEWLVAADILNTYPAVRKHLNAGLTQPDQPVGMGGYLPTTVGDFVVGVVRADFEELWDFIRIMDQGFQVAKIALLHEGERHGKKTALVLAAILKDHKDDEWFQDLNETLMGWRKGSDPIYKNLTPPNLLFADEYAKGICVGFANGLASYLDTFNLKAIIDQLLELVEWMCDPDKNFWQHIADQFKPLIQLWFHDYDLSTLPVDARGEIVGQLLAMIVIFVVTLLINPATDLVLGPASVAEGVEAEVGEIAGTVRSMAGRLKQKVPTLPSAKQVVSDLEKMPTTLERGIKAGIHKAGKLGSEEEYTGALQRFKKFLERSPEHYKKYMAGDPHLVELGPLSKYYNPIKAHREFGAPLSAALRSEIEKAYDELIVPGLKRKPRLEYITNDGTHYLRPDQFSIPPRRYGVIRVASDILQKEGEEGQGFSFHAVFAHEFGERHFGFTPGFSPLEEGQATAWGAMNVGGLTMEDKRIMAMHVRYSLAYAIEKQGLRPKVLDKSIIDLLKLFPE